MEKGNQEGECCYKSVIQGTSVKMELFPVVVGKCDQLYRTKCTHTHTQIQIREIWIRWVDCIDVNILLVIWDDSCVNVTYGRNWVKAYTGSFCIIFTRANESTVISIKFLIKISQSFGFSSKMWGFVCTDSILI